MQQKGRYADFPAPCRLTRLSQSTDNTSVGNTASSQENSTYYSTLINGCSNKIPLVDKVQQPPRVTIDMISYCKMAKKGVPKQTSPTTILISTSSNSNKTRNSNETVAETIAETVAETIA